MGYVNLSNTSNTVKVEKSLMDSDTYCIEKTLTYCKYKTVGTKVVLGNILDYYRDYFEQFLVEEKLDKKYWNQPAYFAEDYYGTADLDFLVLYFARISTLFDFNKKKIKVLPRERIPEINKLFVEYRKYVTDSYNNPVMYFKDIVIK